MAEQDIIARLRAATEHDVHLAMVDAWIELPISDPAQLLEFHNKMLDLVLGQEPDNPGIAIRG